MISSHRRKSFLVFSFRMWLLCIFPTFIFHFTDLPILHFSFHWFVLSLHLSRRNKNTQKILNCGIVYRLWEYDDLYLVYPWEALACELKEKLNRTLGCLPWGAILHFKCGKKDLHRHFGVENNNYFITLIYFFLINRTLRPMIWNFAFSLLSICGHVPSLANMT